MQLSQVPEGLGSDAGFVHAGSVAVVVVAVVMVDMLTVLVAHGVSSVVIHDVA